jgi:N-methylhydantoinase A
MRYLLGIDVGGTFTDFVAVDDARRVSVFKNLTTPADPSVGVIDGAARFAEQRSAPLAAATRIIHGTTLVANSLIERRGARTALVTTAGFADVLEIAREARYDLYDLNLERPAPLVPRPLRFEIAERVLADGTVAMPLREVDARVLVGRLREAEAESVAVCLLHAYANPAHEQHLAEVIRREAPEIDVTLSSEVAPEWREYERGSTAAANAYVRPLVRRYLAHLEAAFAERGARGRLYVVLSHGGLTSAGVAAETPVQMVESGPAGGVMAAAYFSRRCGLTDLISFDMGGTTAKVSLVLDGEPQRVSECEVARVARFKRGSGLPLKVPSIELIEIGTGGGSIAHADPLGLLKVGPESAGADPGPACYGRGGDRPTVTDADLYLGLLDPAFFLGGTMPLHRDRAEAALAGLGRQLQIDAGRCAQGVFEIVNRQMALAMRTHVVERGRDPRRFTLVAFGGAGPVHAYEVARHLGILHILYPPAAGVASALGFLVSPFIVDAVRTYPGRLGRLDWDAVAARFADMEAQAMALLRRAGADVGRIAVERWVDMRYVGQGYEVAVDLPPGSPRQEMEATLRRAFDAAYARRYGTSLSSVDAEAVHWHFAARGGGREIDIQFAVPAGGEAGKPSRRAFFPELGDYARAAVLDRYRLAPGAVIRGPALVEERESTIVVGPSASAEVDALGNLLVTFGRGEDAHGDARP